MQYPASVAVTWEATFAQLTEPERRLLEVLAWLAPEPIPLFLFDAAPLAAVLPTPVTHWRAWRATRWCGSTRRRGGTVPPAGAGDHPRPHPRDQPRRRLATCRVGRGCDRSGRR